MRPRDATPRKKGRFGSVVRACAIAAALFSPFFMTKSARAEDATPEQPAPTCPGGDPVVPLECPISAGEEGTPACVVRTCSGSEVTLRRGDDSYSAFVVDRRRPLPRIEVEGPASVELRFYPAFRREDYNHLGRVEAHVSFVASSDGIDSRLHSFGAEVGSTSMTAVDAEGLNILPQSRAIAGSVGGTLEIDRSISGRPVTISFHENGSGEIPFGFLEVRISRPTRVVEPEAGPELTETEAEVAVETTPPEPAVVPEQEMPARRVFSLLGEREQFHRLGTNTPSADLYHAEISGNIWVSDSLGIWLGALFSSYGMPLNTSELESSLRSYSADGIVGLAYANGEHRLQAGLLAGYRGTRSDAFHINDISSSDSMENTYELGGIGMYGYGDRVAVSLMGTNNPFNPISSRVYVGLFSWTERPLAIQADFRWMRGLNTRQTEAGAEAFDLVQDNYYMRGTVIVPTYHFLRNHFLASVLLAGDMNFSETGDAWGDFLVGLRLDIMNLRGVNIEAQGLVSVLTGRPSAVGLSLTFDR